MLDKLLPWCALIGALATSERSNGPHHAEIASFEKRGMRQYDRVTEVAVVAEKRYCLREGVFHKKRGIYSNAETLASHRFTSAQVG